MPSLDELLKQQQQQETIDPEKNSEVSTLESVLAGIGSGLIKVPEGFCIFRCNNNGFRWRYTKCISSRKIF